jgi:hypothetical protein
VGCALPDETSPVLEMPRGSIAELYLGDPSAVPRLVFDYLVTPRPRIVGYRVDFDFDAHTLVASRRFVEDCPAALATSTLLAAPFDETVVSAKVTVHEADGQARAARLSFARGSRTLSLRAPPELEGGADLFLLFEPAAGAARIALRSVRVEEGAVRAPNMPSVAGVVALVRSPRLGREGDEVVVHAPEGFGVAWRLGVTVWYGAFTTGEERAPIALAPRLLEGEAPILASEERAELGADRPVAVVPLLRRDTRTELVVPCDAAVQVISDGVAALEATRADDARALGYGEATLFSPRCDPGTRRVAPLVVRGRARSGRKAYALVRLVGAS